MMPATNCVSCNIISEKTLNDYPYAYIMHSESVTCPAVKPSQKCVEYRSEKAGKLGLLKLYAQLFVIKDHQIISRMPIK